MNKSIILLAGILTALSTFAQEGQFAPLNPDYVRYQESLKTPEGKKSAAAGRFGYVPSPLQLNFANYKGTGSTQNKKGVSSFLPSRFDLRDSGYVSPVKDQKDFGTCVAFAAIGAIESNWLVNHWGTYDLSEKNMVTCNKIVLPGDVWGTETISSTYITRFGGPVLEEDDPYVSPMICNNNQLKVPRYVLSTNFLPADFELVKRTIQCYGGVQISMIWGDNMFEVYNYTDYTYYQVGNPRPQNHSVVLVGWDDEKIVTGGTLSPKGTKGAWIAKNSWGPYFGEGGFFYISYYDNLALAPIMYFDKSIDTSEIDHLNMYDDLGASKAFGFKKEVAYGLTRFHAAEKEIIKMVGTFILSACSSIDIEIYKTFSEGKLSGLFYQKKNIPCEFPGQRVFDIFTAVEGEYFVKIRYNTPTCLFPMPVEAHSPGWSAPVISETGTNWVSADGETWEAVGMGVKDREMDLTIRSYTVSPKKAIGYFELSKKQLCFGESLIVFAEVIDSVVKCKWEFLPDGTALKDTGLGPISAQFTSPGEKTVNLILNNNFCSDTISQKLDVVSSLDVEINHAFDYPMDYSWLMLPERPRSALDKSIFLSVHADADSFKWNYPYDTINKSEISVSPNHIGRNLYYVTAYQGNCIGSDTISIEGFDGLFGVSADSLLLGCDSGSIAKVIIEADTSWNVSASSTIKKWLGYSPENCHYRDTITVFSISANQTGKIRNGYITIKGALMKAKIIKVYQEFDPAPGIDELPELKAMFLYPNPSATELFIKGLDGMQLATYSFTICDITGRVIRKVQVKNDGKIDISGLSKGLYFLDIREVRSRVAVLRFVKE